MAYDDSGNLQNSLSASLATGTLNDLGRTTFVGYISGSTNRLILTPAVGGTTITGIDASGCSDGFSLLLVNNSATDSVSISHQTGSLVGNQFTAPQGATYTLLPLTAVRVVYVVSKWVFT